MKNKDLMNLMDMTVSELHEVLDLAVEMKKNRGSEVKSLMGKTIGLIFLKSSTRTRVSFETGVNELGGYPMYLDQSGLQLGRGESFEDTAKVLSRYLHGIVIRGHEHDLIKQFADAAEIPVINALTDLYHPCQLLADMQTIREQFGRVEGIKAAFIGDTACNMSNSWILAASMMGMELSLGGPQEFHPDLSILPGVNKDLITIHEDPKEAVKGAQVVYTDVWVSMGFEEESKDRLKILQPYQVNSELLSHASDDVRVMHCLPAYRGQEITAEVLESKASVIWDEAENRLHAQKAMMALKF